MDKTCLIYLCALGVLTLLLVWQVGKAMYASKRREEAELRVTEEQVKNIRLQEILHAESKTVEEHSERIRVLMRELNKSRGDPKT